MGTVYESIMKGLNEAIEDASTEKKTLRRNTLEIDPIKQYEPAQVKDIRIKTGFTQKAFAGYIGVSIKTVEAWEAGTNKPSGAASRILSMMETDKNLIRDFPFVKNIAEG